MSCGVSDGQMTRKLRARTARCANQTLLVPPSPRISNTGVAIGLLLDIDCLPHEFHSSAPEPLRRNALLKPRNGGAGLEPDRRSAAAGRLRRRNGRGLLPTSSPAGSLAYSNGTPWRRLV